MWSEVLRLIFFPTVTLTTGNAEPGGSVSGAQQVDSAGAKLKSVICDPEGMENNKVVRGLP